MMNKMERDTTCYPLQIFDNWILNIYLINACEDEINKEVAFQLIKKYLNELEVRCISEEFEYFRVGIAFLHYGNRGVDLTIWHCGKWGATYEIFTCSWYCYSRDVMNMELLDCKEPTVCQYEIDILINNLKKIYKLYETVTAKDNIRDKFCELFVT